MSASEGQRLPDDLVEGLSGAGRAEDQATLLATNDADGMLRFSLLSRGEIEPVGESSIALALWSGSHTAANMERTGAGALFRVDGGVARTIRLRCQAESIPFEVTPGLHLSAFLCDVDEVLGDAVGYADIVGALSFRLRDPAPVLLRWEAVGMRLREMVGL